MHDESRTEKLKSTSSEAPMDIDCSSDEETVDVLFHIPQFDDLPKSESDITNQEIEIHGLIGSVFPPEAQVIESISENGSKWPESLKEQAESLKTSTNEPKPMYMRIGDKLFQGEWRDDRLTQIARRRTPSRAMQELMGTPVMIPVPPHEAADANLKVHEQTAIPLCADDVYTADFRRLFVTNQSIGELSRSGTSKEVKE